MRQMAVFMILLSVLAVTCLGGTVDISDIRPAWGQPYTIFFRATGVTGTLRLILFDGGTKLGNIANSVNPVAGMYRWAEAGRHDEGMAPPGVNYRLRIRSSDDSLDVFSDTFCMGGVSSPGGGETWFAGTTHDITWSGVGGRHVRIQCVKGASMEGEEAWTSEAILIPNTGRYSWKIPLDCFSGKKNHFFIVVSTYAGTPICSGASKHFTISPPADPDCIMIQKPLADEEYRLGGASCTIEWKQTTPYCGTHVTIRAVRLENNQTFVIGDHVASSKGVNRWSWSLSAAKFAGVAGHYEIRIKANGKSNEAKSGTITLLPKEE